MTLELRGVELRVDGQMHIHRTDIALASEGFNILLGPTLAGKTTFMRLMAGLEDVMRKKGVREMQTQVNWTNSSLLRFLNAAGFETAPRIVLERDVAEPLTE